MPRVSKSPSIDVELAFDDCVKAAGGRRLEEMFGKSPNFNNADYIFQDDAVVAELKCLEENKGKDEKLRNDVHELYNRYFQEGRTDLLIYREVEVNLTDISEDFAREVMEMYTIPIQRVVKKANKQLRQTKEHLPHQDYTGVLLLVNDGHELLSPGHVKWILQSTLARNSFSSIDLVIFFTVNLAARHPNYDEDLLVWAVLQRPGRELCTDEFLDRLRQAWLAKHKSLIGNTPVKEYVFEGGESLEGMENVRMR
jgi:hypothetical protein